MLISLVTTIGYLSLIALNSPSGNLASSESLIAITVVPLGVLVTISTCTINHHHTHYLNKTNNSVNLKIYSTRARSHKNIFHKQWHLSNHATNKKLKLKTLHKKSLVKLLKINLFLIVQYIYLGFLQV